MFQLLGEFVPRPPTGALPLGTTGGLPSPRPPDFDPQRKFIKSSTGCNPVERAVALNIGLGRGDDWMAASWESVACWSSWRQTRCATVDEKQSRRTIAAAAVPPVCGPLVPRLRSVKETIRAAAPAAVDEPRAMRADERRTTRKLLCQSASGEELSDTAIRPSVPWRSCLGYRHAGCLQLNHRRPPEIRGRGRWKRKYRKMQVQCKPSVRLKMFSISQVSVVHFQVRWASGLHIVFFLR